MRVLRALCAMTTLAVLLVAMIGGPALPSEEGPAPAANDPADLLSPKESIEVTAPLLPMDALIPGDLVQVEVYGHPDLSAGVRIPIQGQATFPLVGVVNDLVGMTAEDLAVVLKKRLEADYLHHATVTVTVREFARRKAFVMGSVAKPSALELTPVERTTALRAISECGGFLPEADRNSIRVIRQTNGKTEVIPLALGAEGDPETAPKDVVLQPHDLVMVGQLDRIYVLGQVNRPGSVAIPTEDGPFTLSKALTLAGGFDRYARESDVQLLRPGEPARTVDLEQILAGAKKAEDPILKPGDTVFVPTRRY